MDFNPVKWSFFLVAAVFAVYASAILMLAGACVFGVGIEKCGAIMEGKLKDAFDLLLASALAFAAGKVTSK